MAAEHTVLSAVGADRFQLLRRIGEGGMGVVYEALDRQNQTRVALKMLKEADASAIYRIKWEFRALSQLFHRNLVQLYELYSDQEERWFFTMELVDDSLDFISHLRQGRLSNVCRHATTIVSMAKTAKGSSVLPDEAPPETAALSARMPNEITGRIVSRSERIECPITDFDALRALLVQLCEGVRELHRNHRLHRDLKPGNALVTREGRVVLLDFGLVKELDSAPERIQGSMSLGDTSYGSVIGTAGYMAPEQAAGLHLTPASDWYAVGTMLFEALTGRLPFTGSATSVLRDKQILEAPMPSELASGIPEELEALCLALLRRQPGERPTHDEILSLLNAKPERRSPQSRPFVGRQAQLTSLAGALAAVRDGATAVCHLQGASGAGKSTLIDRFHKQAKAEGALVLAGRCYENELVPYKAVDAMVDALTSYLLSLPAHRIAKFLPPGTASLARMFPVLQRISAVAKLASEAAEARDPKEARQEACAALRAMLVKLSARQAVVLSIDDLQWGDPESAALLSNLIAGEQPPPVLILFAYRSEYLQRSECLNALAALPLATSRRVIRHDLAVGAFDAGESKQLALALLDASVTERDRHAERIAAEAQGSAMFIGELVQQVAAAPTSAPAPQPTQASRPPLAPAMAGLDQLLWERVQQLPEPARSLIELTAVAGHPLRLGVLKAACGLGSLPLHSLSELRSVRLIRLEGLRPEDTLEPFHDRVRESVVAHLMPEQRGIRHRQLAHALESAGGAEPELLADHFLHAGEAAKASTYLTLAGDQAVRLFAFERAERLLRRGLELAEGPAARAASSERLIHFLTNAARFTEAYLVAIAAVAELGFGLPKRFLPPAFLLEWGRLELRLRGKSMQDLLELPLASDEKFGLAVRLMNAVAKAAYQIRPELCVAVAVRIVNLCLVHGNTRDCAIGYMVFGAIFKGGVLGNYARGYDFGRLALDLVERHGNAEQRAEVSFVVGYFGTAWRRPAVQAEALWRAAYDAGVEHRDLFHTGCAAAATTMSMFMRGVPFDDIRERIHAYRRVLEPAGLAEPLGVMSAITQAMRNLRGQTAGPGTLGSEGFDEQAFLAEVARYGSRHFAHCVHILRMQLLYLWERHEEALEEARVAGTFSKDSTGMLHGSEQVFYHGLIACALARRGAAKASAFLRQARRSQRQLARWATHCPDNFQLRAQLLAAELARTVRRHAIATDLYAAVLLGAETSGQVHLRGLAALLASAHYADQSKWSAAATLRARAAESFDSWGASALAEDIRSRARARSTEHRLG